MQKHTADGSDFIGDQFSFLIRVKPQKKVLFLVAWPLRARYILYNWRSRCQNQQTNCLANKFCCKLFISIFPGSLAIISMFRFDQCLRVNILNFQTAITCTSVLLQLLSELLYVQEALSIFI